VRAGVDSIEHGSQFDRETARLMREQGVFLVPTAWINTEGAGDRGDRPPDVEAKGRPCDQGLGSR
jgi:imidazolonepropionase-like amidohydrolase